MDLETIKKNIIEKITERGINASDVHFEYSADSAHGDLTTNVAMRQAKEAGKNPRELAQEIVDALGDIDGVEKVEVAGEGFINFYLADEVYSNVLKNIGINWGCNESQKGKKVMVEYTDPNPFKEFHIGHLMSNAIGEAIARLIECSGAEVRRANYQGDVGLHVAKAIWGGLNKKGLTVTNHETLGEAYAFGEKMFEENDDAQKEIKVINRKVYDRSDPLINDFYDSEKQVSLDYFASVYKRLDTKFDHYFFESETAPIGKEIIEDNPAVFPESDGARVFKGEEHGLHTRVFVTSDGFPTYEAKDLGLLKTKSGKWNFDISITITADEQTEYFKVVLAAAKQVDGLRQIAEKTKHVAHGMMRLVSGKMSSRTGDVISARELLDDLTEAAKERTQESRAEDKEKLARQIAVAAIKYQILKQSAGKDIVFDKVRALSLEGDSGPYVQYAHARARTILGDAQKEGVEPSAEAPQTEKEREVMCLLAQFPDVVARAQKELEPHYITTYITNLASLYNSWYANERVLGMPDAPRRLAITRAVAHTLKDCLWLLGIEAPERM